MQSPTPLVREGFLEELLNKGIFQLVHRGPNGRIKNVRNVRNLITDAGRAGVAGLINGVTATTFRYIGIGTGATAAAVGDTTIQTEITTNGGIRALGTCTRVTTTVTNDTAQVVLTFAFTGTFAVTEAGLLDAVTTGVLLARQVFSAINVVTGDSLQITWKIKTA